MFLTSSGDLIKEGKELKKFDNENSPVRLIYFSSVSNNTHRFILKTGFSMERIPVLPSEGELEVDYEYVLVTPTYGGGAAKGAIPKQVMKFLKNEKNRGLCRGVIASGNTNFGEGYCLAGPLISRKLQVPYLYRFEIFGTQREVNEAKMILEDFWKKQNIS